MNRTDRICAYCQHFSTKDHPQQAAAGIGACTGYGDSPVEPFVRWDAPFCVLYARAADMAPRRRFVDKQTAQVAA